MPETLTVTHATWLAAYGLMLAGACVSDVYRGRIPNAVVFAGAAFGLAMASIPSGIGAAAALVGLFVGLVVPAIFHRMGVLGAGDVKLLAACGAFVGFPAILNLLLATAVAGGVFSLVVALRSSRLAAVGANLRDGLRAGATTALLLHRMPRAGELPMVAARVPYALAIASGAVYQLFFWSASP